MSETWARFIIIWSFLIILHLGIKNIFWSIFLISGVIFVFLPLSGTGHIRFLRSRGHQRILILIDHEKINLHDSTGITLATAKYLVEQFGSMIIGSDTSGLEQQPAPEGSKTFVPVHNYLLVEQGVHIAEFHYLEELAKNQVYEFCYVASTNKIAGTTAGFAMRPIAMQ